jgi:hypothetical protein
MMYYNRQIEAAHIIIDQDVEEDETILLTCLQLTSPKLHLY